MFSMVAFAMGCALAATVSARTGFLRKAPAVQTSIIESELLSELGGAQMNPERQRHVAQMEDWLRPMFQALPKDEHGHLGHTAVRYALHRLFMQRYSWFLRGLEPGASATGRFSAPTQTNFSLESAPVWPTFLQGDAERHRGGAGLGLREIAGLAATLEDLAHFDTVNRLNMAYDAAEMTTSDWLRGQQVDDVVEKYAVLFLTSWNMPNFTHESLGRAERLQHRQRRWREKIEPWAENVKAKLLSDDGAGGADFGTVARVADVIGQNFSQIFNSECQDLKHMLMTKEDRRPGRIRLSDFYNMSRVSNWAFTEKIEYLRTLGALDESNASNPLVIFNNYITSMPQCMKASGLYLVCCPNECEGLMGHLERKIGAPEATPERIFDVVSGFSSDTIVAPRELSVSLRDRIQEVAKLHGGKVPLHGRLLAQWLHHAFPRECPYPHQAGTTSPLTPDEWIKESGHEDSQASDEEMLQHIRPDDTCPVDAKDGCAGEVELPWNPTEELLHPVRRIAPALATAELASVAQGEAEIAQLIQETEGVGATASATATQKGRSESGTAVVVGSAMSVLGFLGIAVALLRAYGPLFDDPNKRVAGFYRALNSCV